MVCNHRIFTNLTIDSDGFKTATCTCGAKRIRYKLGLMPETYYDDA